MIVTNPVAMWFVSRDPYSILLLVSVFLLWRGRLFGSGHWLRRYRPLYVAVALVGGAALVLIGYTSTRVIELRSTNAGAYHHDDYLTFGSVLIRLQNGSNVVVMPGTVTIINNTSYRSWLRAIHYSNRKDYVPVGEQDTLIAPFSSVITPNAPGYIGPDKTPPQSIWVVRQPSAIVTWLTW